jgi:hypothetical protein
VHVPAAPAIAACRGPELLELLAMESDGAVAAAAYARA